MSGPDSTGKLNLKAGELVEVRSQEEILATLDKHGRLDGMPFMPEMLEYCGRRLRVFKRADKTCDPAHEPWSIRRVTDSVHLEGVRCDGAGHGGCQAGCLIFWREAWLKRAENSIVPVQNLERFIAVPTETAERQAVEKLISQSQLEQPGGGIIYSCQATHLRNFTSSMAAWDPRQYIRDLRSGNLATGLAGDSTANRALEMLLAFIRLFRALTISLFNRVPMRLTRAQYPFIAGTLEKTPVETLNLQDGELVQVLSREEIMKTLDKENRNRGMLFDGEMLPYCGGIYRVLRRVHHIIDERTGKMVNMKHPCIVLEGVVCQSDYHRLCPRAIYPYWRENWLKRAVETPARSSVEQVTGATERT